MIARIMRVRDRDYRSIWIDEEGELVCVDQTLLPHGFETAVLTDFEAVRCAILEMKVRGAGLIGAAAGYGMWKAALEAPRGNEAAFMAFVRAAGERLAATRPTASNLAWAVRRQIEAMDKEPRIDGKIAAALAMATAIADGDAEQCRLIGLHGKSLIEAIARRKPAGAAVNVLTHCNAGWLAFVDHGSALAPVYAAQAAGIPVHVWVDETRPRNQGAGLTAWELDAAGVPHSLIVDNAGGHLMQHGLVDLVIVGADRVTRGGDVANKIGTYLKALAASDNGLPFCVAFPSSTLDLTIDDGVAGIPIEERSPDEVRYVEGRTEEGARARVLVCPDATSARNWGFDVTPARLVTGLITERGVCEASERGIRSLFPEFFA